MVCQQSSTEEEDESDEDMESADVEKEDAKDDCAIRQKAEYSSDDSYISFKDGTDQRGESICEIVGHILTKLNEFKLRALWDNKFISRDGVSLLYADAPIMVEEYCLQHRCLATDLEKAKADLEKAKEEEEADKRKKEKAAKARRDKQQRDIEKRQQQRNNYTCNHSMMEEYEREENAGYCKETANMAGFICAECKAKMVFKKDSDSTDFRPSQATPAMCCVNRQKGCRHAICYPCYLPKVVSTDDGAGGTRRRRNRNNSK